MDRRRAERMTVRLRCFITHPSFDGQCLIGYTDNLSRSGVFIRCTAFDSALHGLPNVGEWITIDLQLPSLRAKAPVRSMCCTANVVRVVDDANGDRCFAAAFCGIQFRDLPRKFLQSATSSQMVRARVV